MEEVFSDRLGRDFARFSVPCVLNLLVFSLYTIADGFFVSKYVGEAGLAAVNLSAPASYLLYSLGIAMAVGAGVLISTALGSGKGREADSLFTSNFCSTALLGVLLALLTLLFLDPICRLLGGEGAALTREYLGVLAPFFPFVMLEYSLEFLVKINGSPRYSLWVIVSTCLFNVFGDWLLMGPFGMGLGGAALATGVSQFLTAALFFMKIVTNKEGTFRLDFSQLRPELLLPGRFLRLGVADGSMELCNALRAWLYNLLLLRMNGTDAVAAGSLVNYAATLCFNVATGIAQGMEPLAAYHRGAERPAVLRRLLRLAFGTQLVCGFFCWGAANLFTKEFCALFLEPSGGAFAMALPAVRRYSLAFLLLGCNVLSSAYLTAVQQPGQALAVSLCRGFLLHGTLLVLFSLLLPDAFWHAAALTELLTLFLSLRFLKKELERPFYAN